MFTSNSGGNNLLLDNRRKTKREGCSSSRGYDSPIPIKFEVARSLHSLAQLQIKINHFTLSKTCNSKYSKIKRKYP